MNGCQYLRWRVRISTTFPCKGELWSVGPSPGNNCLSSLKSLLFSLLSLVDELTLSLLLEHQLELLYPLVLLSRLLLPLLFFTRSTFRCASACYSRSFSGFLIILFLRKLLRSLALIGFLSALLICLLEFLDQYRSLLLL